MEKESGSKHSWWSSAGDDSSVASSAVEAGTSEAESGSELAKSGDQKSNSGRRSYPELRIGSDGTILNPIPTRLFSLERSNAKRKRENTDTRFGDTPTTLPTGYQLQVQDVLCVQRGSRESTTHPGNERLRVLVGFHKESYRNAASRGEKTALVRKVVDVVRQSGGNFVRSDGELWYDVGDLKAREKVGCSFRAATSNESDRNRTRPLSNPLQPKPNPKRLRRYDSDPQPSFLQVVEWSLASSKTISPTQFSLENTGSVQPPVANTGDKEVVSTRDVPGAQESMWTSKAITDSDWLHDTTTAHEDSAVSFSFEDVFRQGRESDAAFATSLMHLSPSQDSSNGSNNYVQAELAALNASTKEPSKLPLHQKPRLDDIALKDAVAMSPLQAETFRFPSTENVDEDEELNRKPPAV